MDTKQITSLRVVMLPWLAHGHISPYLELAKKLTRKNFHIYLCTTSINLASIKKRITHNYSRSIQLIELHLPSLPELPPHYHTTNGLPPHLKPTLRMAFDMSTQSFSNILTKLTPDLVIYDFNQPWAPATAASHNIPAIEFLTTGATVVSLGLHMLKKPGLEFPFPAVRPREILDVRFQDTVNSSVNRKDRLLLAIERSCDVILTNTFRELEGKYIDYLSVLAEKRIVPVGPLVQDIAVDDDDKEVMKWLDEKDESSTVFVSFGSEYFPSQEEMEEVAHGLELSNVNFIWVIRFPVGEKIKVEEALPKGFLDKVGKRGLVVEGWAPQAKILAHSSIGGFVSHCGWNSIMESLKFGVPIIAMPMHLDQPPNARLVEEIGVAVEVNRNKNGSLSMDEMAQAIRKVVVEKNGEPIRIKAREFSENIRVKEGIDDGVAEELVQLCEQRKKSLIN